MYTIVSIYNIFYTLKHSLIKHAAVRSRRDELFKLMFFFNQVFDIMNVIMK